MSTAPPDPQKPRLREVNAPEMLNSAMAERTNPVTIDLYWEPLELFDLAHCVMLVEQGVIPPAPGSALLADLLALREGGREAIPLDPRVGDLLMNRERALIGRLGEEVGGRLHTARSRGDTYQGVLPRLAERERLLLLLEAELDLGETLVRLAREHVDTVMPGYSHLQQAQPTTLGHYLLGSAYPIVRNLERGLQAFARTNQSPAGAGILTGSGYPVNRERTAELLGFDGVLGNTRDAVWSEDHTLDAFMVAVQAMTNVVRLAQDLEIWATYEFGMIELADRHCSTSSIMPQKKNPYALEYLRSLTGAVQGALAGYLAILKAPSEEIDILFYQPRLYDLMGQVARGCTLMARVLDGLTIHRARMAELAGANFTQATDMADVIGLERDLAFRTVHRILGTLVRLASERQLTPADITPALLDEAAQAVIGRPLGFSAAELQALLDPHALVARRQLTGGPAPDQVRRQADDCARELAAAATSIAERRQRLAAAERTLLARAAALAASDATVQSPFSPAARTSTEPA